MQSSLVEGSSPWPWPRVRDWPQSVGEATFERTHRGIKKEVGRWGVNNFMSSCCGYLLGLADYKTLKNWLILEKKEKNGKEERREWKVACSPDPSACDALSRTVSARVRICPLAEATAAVLGEAASRNIFPKFDSNTRSHAIARSCLELSKL